MLLIALTLPSHNHLFRGKPDGELWASEKNDLCAAISTGILGRVGAEGFWAARLLRSDGRLPSFIRLFPISGHLYLLIGTSAVLTFDVKFRIETILQRALDCRCSEHSTWFRQIQTGTETKECIG